MAMKGHVLGTSFLRYEWVLESPEAQDRIGSGHPPAELGAHLPWSFKHKVAALPETLVQVLGLPQLPASGAQVVINHSVVSRYRPHVHKLCPQSLLPAGLGSLSEWCANSG